MKKIPYLLAFFLLSFLFLSEAGAKEKACKVTHNITSVEVDTIKDIGPIQTDNGETIDQAVEIKIRVKGSYTIQHKDDAQPGPTQSINVTIPYVAPNQTRDTIPTIIIDSYKNLAPQDLKAKLDKGLKKACEQHGCNKE